MSLFQYVIRWADMLGGRSDASVEEVDALEERDLQLEAYLERVIPPLGVVEMFAGATPPAGWLLADGSEVSREAFRDLFVVIGTTYGVGDGSTTFNVPDLRQRFPLGKADSGTGSTLGETGGNIDHFHGLDNGSAHARFMQGLGIEAKTVSSRMTVPQWTANVEASEAGSAASTEVRTAGVRLAGTTDTSNPPYLTLNFIIRAA